MLLRDRKEAGERLAPLLNKYCDTNTLVMATRPASLEVAYHVAREKSAELSLMITKNLTYPGYEEYSFGALSEGDKMYIDSSRHLPSDDLIQSIVANCQKEIRRKLLFYRYNNPLPALTGRNVILISDGIDLGLEFIPAIRLCRSLNVNKVILCVPVAGRSLDKHLQEADDMIVLQTMSSFPSMDKVYRNFDPIPEDEVRELLISYEETRNII
jgi:putative phosphoribosyl transferase